MFRARRRSCVTVATRPCRPWTVPGTLLLLSVSGMQAPAQPTQDTADLESRWALVSPHAFIPAAAEFVWWPLRDISRTLRHLENVAIVQPGDRAECRDYFKSSLTPGDLILTACLERAAEGGDVLTLTSAGSEVMTITVDTDGEPSPRALANLDFEGIDTSVRKFTAVISTPRLSIRFEKDDTITTAAVESEVGPRLTYRASSGVARREWRFEHRLHQALEPTVLLWTAFKEGDELSMELALRRDSKTVSPGKIPFYGAVNRWVLDPLCTVGEQARAAIAVAIDWPQELDRLKRDCADEGIRVGGRRVWFQ